MKLMDAGLLRQKAWIDGQWVDAHAGKTLTVTNPADGTILGTVPSLSQDETIKAINAAEKALTAWRQQTVKERFSNPRCWET